MDSVLAASAAECVNEGSTNLTRLLLFPHLHNIDYDAKNLIDLSQACQVKDGCLIKKGSFHLPCLLSPFPDLTVSLLTSTSILKLRSDVTLKDRDHRFQHLKEIPEYESKSNPLFFTRSS